MSGRLRSNGILLLLVVCCSLYLALPAVVFGQSAGEPGNPLFAFCMDTHDAKKRTLAQQAEMLEELGFDGAGHVGLDNVAELARTGVDWVSVGLLTHSAPAVDVALEWSNPSSS